jgi:hypothetical protein
MSPVQAVDAGAEARHDGHEVDDQPLHVGEPIPAVCDVTDMCRIFRLARSTFYRHRREFEKFLLNGSDTRWSGYRIAQHLRAGATSITVKRS